MRRAASVVSLLRGLVSAAFKAANDLTNLREGAPKVAYIPTTCRHPEIKESRRRPCASADAFVRRHGLRVAEVNVDRFVRATLEYFSNLAIHDLAVSDFELEVYRRSPTLSLSLSSSSFLSLLAYSLH